MHYSFRTFPELKSFDKTEQYQALKFCLKSSKWFNYTFLPCLLLISLISIKLIKIMIKNSSIEIAHNNEMLIVFITAAIINVMFIIATNATVVHHLVKRHINDYKQA